MRVPAAAVAFVLAFAATAAPAQTNPRYIRFPGVPAAVKGLYLPDPPQPPPGSSCGAGAAAVRR
jgi:hypothetical protein